MKPRFRYTGKLFDDATDLQWNINRWYDPNVGRWLSEDVIGFKAGDENLVRYVGNSVISFVDYFGFEYAEFKKKASKHVALRWPKTKKKTTETLLGFYY